MEQFSAVRFYRIGGVLRVLIDLAESDVPINQDILKSCFANINHSCSEIGLRVSLHALKELETGRTNGFSDNASLKNALCDLENVIRWEMNEHVFMHLPSSRENRYDKENAFGEEVDKKFPTAKFDIKEAGNCYTTARFTACVFHLMRALEIGLAAFAKLFNVPSDHTNWHNIIEGIEKAVRNMRNDPSKKPDWKEKHEFYAQVVSGFMFFKDAWRNYTAHARGKYTEEEADAIYRNVGAFMKKLAEGGIPE